jgi:diaminopimelate decarboxylase
VNPDVDARTHRYISTGLKTSKFGVPFTEAVKLYGKSRKLKGVVARGVDCHIGSQLTEAAPVQEALEKVAGLYRKLEKSGLELGYLDVGGGLGITYRDETPPSPAEYAKVVLAATRGLGATLVLEPGRVLVGNAGLLLTRVLFNKRTPAKHFVIVDAGMNDLIRPALYEAHHEIQPVERRLGGTVKVDIVGPVCESSDVLGRERRLVSPRAGELLAVMSAGAYGMVMASNYNSRGRPAEVLVDGAEYRVVRAREGHADLWRGESF